MEALRQMTYLSKSVNAVKPVRNTSEIFESLQHFSKNEEDRPLDTAGLDGGEGTGCFPTESSDDEGGCSVRGKSSLCKLLI